jgi:predicted DNA-binding transcriptional regulator YafY
MRAGFDLPPLMFSTGEAKALVACARLAQPRLDTALARDAESALAKILAVLPTAARAAAESMAVYAIDVGGTDLATRQRLQVLREAFEAKRVLELDYHSLDDVRSRRRVRPLGVFFWDAVWTLAAWCELRDDFRSFRVDRIAAVDVLDERFRDEAGKTLADLFRRVRDS